MDHGGPAVRATVREGSLFQFSKKLPDFFRTEHLSGPDRAMTGDGLSDLFLPVSPGGRGIQQFP